MKTKCSVCDYENEEGTKFCSNCNEPLSKPGFSNDNPYLKRDEKKDENMEEEWIPDNKKRREKDQPFELISDEEAYEIKRKSEKKFGFKLVSKKTLIILMILVAIAAVAIISNYLLELKNEEKTTMDTLYENLEKSMKSEDIESIKELTNKAILLLPENEREELTKLLTRFGKYGYSALTENETFLMQELNNKAMNLLPEKDRTKLYNLMKKAYDSLTD